MSAVISVNGSQWPLIRGFMFDLDGTLLLSDRALGGYELLPGAVHVEVIMARRGGATAFGVTSGVMTRDDWARQSGTRLPHFVISQVGELLTQGVIQSVTAAKFFWVH